MDLEISDLRVGSLQFWYITTVLISYKRKLSLSLYKLLTKKSLKKLWPVPQGIHCARCSLLNIHCIVLYVYEFIRNKFQCASCSSWSPERIFVLLVS